MENLTSGLRFSTLCSTPGRQTLAPRRSRGDPAATPRATPRAPPGRPRGGAEGRPAAGSYIVRAMYWPLVGGFIAFILLALVMGWIMDPDRHGETDRDQHH